MYAFETIEYDRLLNESKKIIELEKKGELIKCKRISSRKLYNVCQLLQRKNLDSLETEEIDQIIKKETVLIFDLRDKKVISESGFKINGAIDCLHSFEKVRNAFSLLQDNDSVIQDLRKIVILYDNDGNILDEEGKAETNLNAKNENGCEIRDYFKRSIKLIRGVYILKGGFKDFYCEFPFLCCPVGKFGDIGSVSISSFKSPKDIPNHLRSKIVASIEYPLTISWGKDFKIYMGNIIQGCHPQILKTLNIKTVFDFTPNKIENDKDIYKGIRFFHIKKDGIIENKQTAESLLFKETIDLLKELEEMYSLQEIFPLIIVSTNVTNEIVSVSAVIVSYLRKWKITQTLIFLLGQLCLDNHIITPTENKDIYNKIHPTNNQINNMLSSEFM